MPKLDPEKIVSLATLGGCRKSRGLPIVSIASASIEKPTQSNTDCLAEWCEILVRYVTLEPFHLDRSQRADVPLQ